MIGLTEALPERDEKYELHRLLSALLSSELPMKEKLNIIKTEYNIPLEDDARKEVDVMCNLSQGVLEKGEARGEAKIIVNMSKKGYTIEQIADVTDKDVEEVKAIIEKHQPALA
jgi:predicted transposase YdaD